MTPTIIIKNANGRNFPLRKRKQRARRVSLEQLNSRAKFPPKEMAIIAICPLASDDRNNALNDNNKIEFLYPVGKC